MSDNLRVFTRSLRAQVVTQFAFKMRLFNLVPGGLTWFLEEQTPLGTHPELTLKATRNVFAKRVALSVSSRMPQTSTRTLMSIKRQSKSLLRLLPQPLYAAMPHRDDARSEDKSASCAKPKLRLTKAPSA